MYVIRVANTEKNALVAYLESRGIRHTIFSVAAPWTQYCANMDEETCLFISLSFACKIYSRDAFIREYNWDENILRGTPLGTK
jgi:hypothetical protein